MRGLLKDHPTELEKYNSYFVKNFVETSKTTKYCPAPGCDLLAIGSGVTNVSCSCSFPFCFKCGQEAHDPSSCDQLTAWLEKCINDSETANWILANTRKCPVSGKVAIPLRFLRNVTN